MIIKNRLGKPLLEVESRRDQLEGVVLENAHLPEADLREADLYEAYLPGANLQGADLRAANLRGATLREANLQNADLSGADLSLDNINHAADLCGANLKGALLEEAYLYGAVFDTLTIWPDGYTPNTKTKDNGVGIVLVDAVHPDIVRRSPLEVGEQLKTFIRSLDRIGSGMPFGISRIMGW